jgi:primosomal replication protein N
MRLGLVPRLLPRGHGRPLTAEDPLIAPPGGGEEINRAVLSGPIAAEPLRDTSRDGAPITVLLVSFSAPDESAHDSSSCCEIEVTDSIADRHRRRLSVGRRVWVAGQLTGTGLWATSLGTAPPVEAIAE